MDQTPRINETVQSTDAVASVGLCVLLEKGSNTGPFVSADWNIKDSCQRSRTESEYQSQLTHSSCTFKILKSSGDEVLFTHTDVMAHNTTHGDVMKKFAYTCIQNLIHITDILSKCLYYFHECVNIS